MNPYPLDALHCIQFAQQGGQHELFIKVIAVLGGVLGDEVDFLRAVLCQPARLLQHALYRLAHMRPAKRRNCAEGAFVVATFGDLQVRRPRGAAGQARGHIRPAVVWRLNVGYRLACGAGGVHNFRETRHLTHADPSVHFGELLLKRFAQPLYHAACNDDALCLALSLEAQRVANNRHPFALRRLQKPAGVDDHHIGRVGVRVEPIARALQHARNLFGVHLVLGATERNQAHRRYFRHRAKVYLK
jgi:hypothetical protein